MIKGNHTKGEEDELIRKADFDWLRHILDEHDKENAQNSFCNDGNDKNNGVDEREFAVTK